MGDYNHKIVRKMLLGVVERCICGGRADANGKPENTSEVIQKFWNVYLDAKKGQKELSAADVDAMMMLLKIARIATGYGGVDSWVDAAGYAIIGADEFIKISGGNLEEITG